MSILKWATKTFGHRIIIHDIPVKKTMNPVNPVNPV